MSLSVSGRTDPESFWRLEKRRQNAKISGHNSGSRRLAAKLLLIFLTLYKYNGVLGHIRLTYPPARSYPFDFLDNVRTSGPCGVPSAAGPATNILPGSTFDVTWHLGYPHQGGYRIELINSKNQVISVLAPTDSNTSYVQSKGATTQSQTVTIPSNLVCDDCFIRLLRQAKEWTAGPDGYLFWSCADVNIKSGLDPCRPNGISVGGKCECGPKYTGQFCENYDECVNDADCMNQGKCIDTRATTFPQKVCYCKWGFMGTDCSSISTLNTWDFDPRYYNLRHLSTQPGNEYALYWRLFPDINEIEMVLRANTTNWLGLGWRPNNLRSKCQHFPINLQYGGVPLYPKSDQKPIINKATIPTKEPVSQNEPISEAKPEPKAEALPKPETPATVRIKRQALNATFKQGNEGDYPLVTNDMPGQKTTPIVLASADTGKKVLKISQLVTAAPTSTQSSTSTPTQISSEPLKEPTIGAESVVAKAETKPSPVPISERPTNVAPDSIIIPESESSLIPTSEQSLGTVPKPESNSSLNPVPEKSPTIVPEPRSELFAPEGALGIPEPESKSTLVPNPEQPVLASGKAPGSEPMSRDSPRVPVSEEDLNDIATKGNAIHPMDCLDVVIGHANGYFFRIDDYYSRDRSTPILDKTLGGRNDISGALGYEKDGITTLIFRKKIMSSDLADHSIINAPMHISWAKGQNVKAPFHRPFSGIETGSASDRNFYKDGEIKYHGTRSDQRGSEILNFYEKPELKPIPVRSNSTGGNSTFPICDMSEWRYPPDCKDPDCSYKASWTFQQATDDIAFKIVAQNSMNKWTGIGFSKSRKMPNSDLVYGWITADKKVVVFDSWSSSYGQPAKDISQNIYDVEGSFDNMTTTLKFKRKRMTGDMLQDVQFSDTECNYLFFPYVGAEWQEDGSINRHEVSPIVTTNPVCIRPCTSPVMVNEPMKTHQENNNDTGSALNFNFKLQNEWNDNLMDPSNPETQLLANELRVQIRNVLSGIPQLHKVMISGFKRGSVIVQSKVAIASNRPETLAMIKGLLMMAIMEGKLGNLKVDPQSIDITDAGCYGWGKFYEAGSQFSVVNKNCNVTCRCLERVIKCEEDFCQLVDNSLNFQDSRIRSKAIPVRLSTYSLITCLITLLFTFLL